MLRLSKHPLYIKILQTTQLRYAHRINHYEVLKLQSNCTPKEIREAFIRLSKELHPDVNASNGNKKANEKSFVQLLEAYKVLSKPDSRSSYDYELAMKARPQSHPGGNQNIQNQHWYPNSAHYQEPDPNSFYGFKGIKKVSNWTIVFYCLVFMFVGIIVQAYAISKSFTFSREQLDEDSRRNSQMLAKARAEAQSNGNDAQLERMKATLNKETMW
ncbi:AAEL011082-PA [Aedes aegypti]|uniref:AAEL011082-PA n=2 Tax=Aedes aegypti TaxID=7159 RepID=A0A1S4FSG6_AEDAE|nr:dnaJ-like protein 60 [Aedes aegypti]EAT36868.1 AAEL011082-PA [Aedes aegypti]